MSGVTEVELTSWTYPDQGDEAMQTLKTHGRTILTHDPQQIERDGKTFIETLPVFVDLRMRKATTSPEGTRIKCVLVADAKSSAGPLPFARAVIGKGKTRGGKPKTPNGWTPEFRLEMN